MLQVATLLVQQGAAIAPTKGGRPLRSLDPHVAADAEKLAASLGRPAAGGGERERPTTAPM